MSRPGFVLEVDERTPAAARCTRARASGWSGCRSGSRVIYPPESLPALRDLDAAIRHALPTRSAASRCPSCCYAGMRLTIVFDDLSIPLPPMQTPDIRQRIIEHVLEMAAAKGVDDVELIAGNALHRRMTPAELQAHRRRAGLPLVLPATTCATTTPRTAPTCSRSARPSTARSSRSTGGRPRAT